MKGLGHGIVVVLVVVLANACVVSDGLPPLPYLHYHSSNYYKTTCDLDVVETKNAFRKAYNYTRILLLPHCKLACQKKYET